MPRGNGQDPSHSQGDRRALEKRLQDRGLQSQQEVPGLADTVADEDTDSSERGDGHQLKEEEKDVWWGDRYQV